MKKLLDSLSDNYIAKDILDYAPTKSQVRDALLISAKKEQPELINTYFERNENETLFFSKKNRKFLKKKFYVIRQNETMVFNP